MSLIHNKIEWLIRNHKMIRYCSLPVQRNKVNLNYCTGKNLGDLLSPVVVKYVLSTKSISPDIHIKNARHLYAIGSILTMGKQDTTVWGSGAINEDALTDLYVGKNKYGRNIDFRAVRGKYTRELCLNAGYNVPEVYGDPAILMPYIYQPENVEKKYDISVIVHFDKIPNDWKQRKDIHYISIATADYKSCIDEIVASKKIISSSLHGIILAETYRVPCVMILNDVFSQIFKFFDYYSGSNRYEFSIASSLDSAIKMNPTDLPDKNLLVKMQRELISTFPFDIYRNPL